RGGADFVRRGRHCALGGVLRHAGCGRHSPCARGARAVVDDDAYDAPRRADHARAPPALSIARHGLRPDAARGSAGRRRDHAARRRRRVPRRRALPAVGPVARSHREPARRGDEDMNGDAALVSLSPRDYDAVLFDLDGVLTRTADVHAAAWKWLFDEYLERHAERTGET